MSELIKGKIDILKGEKVKLKGIVKATQEYVGWLNDKDINQYLESRFIVQTLETVQQFLDNANASMNDYMFGIYTNKHIGNIKLHINWQHKLGDIGFLIGDKSSWGKGYATEAIKVITHFAFDTLELNKVYAGVYFSNMGSIKALQGAGYKQEAILEKQYLCNNEYIDSVIMAIWR